MWDEQKRSRFEQLRSRKSESLNASENAELAVLTHALEAAEASYLEPATQKLRQERETIDAQNKSLHELARRKESLVRGLRAFLAEAEAERRAIDCDLAAVLAETRSSPDQ